VNPLEAQFLTMLKRQIKVFPGGELQSRPQLFRALAEAFSLRFTVADAIEDSDDPLIVFASNARDLSLADGRTAASFVVMEPMLAAVPRGDSEVRLGHVPGVDLNVSGLKMTEDVSETKALTPERGFEAAAFIGTQPVWTCKTSSPNPHYRAAFGPSELQVGELLVDHVKPGRFLRLLPLVHFLHSVTAPKDFSPIPPMAALVIDDPNLHWPTYGHVHFEEFSRHAQKHNYHVAIGTIPLDTWTAHPSVVEIFKQNPKRLSLLIHGNDHIKLEMSREITEDETLRMLAQSLRRIDTFEARFGLCVARVMEAPFAASNIASVRAMQKLGYDATLMGAEQVLQQSRHDGWPASFGLNTVDLLASGFPGIARLRILGDWKTALLLNACLHQPFVVTTHHQDAAGGLHLYEEAASYINNLGPVRWCDLGTMASALFQTRVSRDTMEARVFARKTSLSVSSAEIRELIVRPMWQGGSKGIIAWGDDTKSLVAEEINDDTVRIQIKGCQKISLVCAATGIIDHEEVPPPRLRPWAYFRRALTATRDRVRPFLVGDQKKKISQMPAASNLTKGLEEHEFLRRGTGH
jgi:hypothetical protein